ncbi:MAG: hypothetical protein ACR2H1_09495, partial [Limisphaerales bacterium]
MNALLETIALLEVPEKVLFRLPEIMRDIKRGLPIFVCENEMDAQEMVKNGFSATCNGTGKWQENYNETLRGADVALLVNKDAAELIGSKLNGIAKSVRILELPDVNGTQVKDAHDFFVAGGDSGMVQDLFDAAKCELSPMAARVARPLSEFIHHKNNDPDELLKHRFLCRLGTLLLCGPTGIGKSALSLQCAILWALGRPCFG